MSKKVRRYLYSIGGILGLSSTAVAVACGQGGNKQAKVQSNPGDENTPGNNPNNPGGGEKGLTPEERQKFEEEHTQRVANSVNQKTNRYFTQPVRQTLKLGVTWSQNGTQTNALKAIVKVYNDKVKELKATPENQKEAKSQELGISTAAKEIEVSNYGNSYGDGQQSLTRDLTAQNTKGKNTVFDAGYNLLIGYPVIASTLNKDYNLLLNFNSEDDSLDIDIKRDFAKSFISANYNTEGMKEDGTFVLPLFKSTNVLSINAPVLGYFIETMKNKGVKFNNDFDAIIQKSKADRSVVQKKWGEPVSTAEQILRDAGYISEGKILTKEDLFGSYTKMIDFSKTMQSLFTNSSNTNNTTLHVFGIDDMAGVYNQALYSALGAQADQMIAIVATVNGQKEVKYDTLKNSSSTAYKLSKDIFDKFAEGFSNKGVYAYPGGQYASTDQINHKVAFSIGSSAGFEKNYKVISDADYSIADANSNFLIPSNDKGKVFWFVDKSKDNATDLLAKVGSYKNNIYTHNTTSTLKSYDLKVKDSDNENKLKQLENDKKNLVISLSLKDDEKKSTFVTTLKDKITKNENSVGDKVQIIELVNKNNDSFAFIVLKDVLTKPISKIEEINGALDQAKFEAALTAANLIKKPVVAADVLTQDELFAFSTPLKWKSDDVNKNVLYLQGPSLIGQLSNDEDEDATRAFVKWLISTKKTYEFQSDTLTLTTTPLRFLEIGLSYIAGTKDFLNLSNTDFGKNLYLQTFLTDSKETLLKPNEFFAFEEPAGPKADTFRDNIKAAWKGKVDQYTTKNKTDYDFTKFINQITTFTKNSK
ncbi:putative lipoprotein [Mycoplasmopsis mustelae]|uniref:Putative lipoprotein n=1 Tax=Mycoplasmopsis mustelae TaxID=171289 RepID=A0A4R7UCP5_9BACT|nr:P80 family lipoprotein [Mycoplasmopsis mustelae]TDV24159.1 putative lipoprotein [Mycoplasmopsis mustelae]